jgi:hypothetical protein
MPWIAAGGLLLSGALGASSSKKAAAQQQHGAREAILEQRYQNQIARETLAPWTNLGGQAIGRLGTLMGLPSVMHAGKQYWATTEDQLPGSDIISLGGRLYSPTPPEGAGDLTRKFTLEDFASDPVTQLSFQHGLDEGRKAIERRSPLTSGYDSGATLKALTRFGTDYGNQKAGESRGRFVEDQTNLYNRMAGLAGSGQTASTQVGANAMQTGQNVSGILSSLGDAMGASKIAQGNAWGQALGGGLQTIGDYWNQKSMLDQILNRRGSPTSQSNALMNMWGAVG